MQSACDNCGKEEIVYDSSSGSSHCVACGLEQSCGDLTSAPETDADGRQCGHFVGRTGKVSGSTAGRNRTYTGLLNSCSEGEYFPSGAYREMDLLVSRLGCTNELKEDALFYMQSAYPMVGGSGRMPLEIMAAACLWVAVRNHKLPVSVTEISGNSSKFVVGAAYKDILVALNSHQPLDSPGYVPPAVEYLNFVRRHVPHLQPLDNSSKKVYVVETYVMLMQWVQLSPTAPAASTPALAAAVLQLAAQAHMVKIKPENLEKVFNVKAGAIYKRSALIRKLLSDTAEALPWLSKVTVKNVTQYLFDIMKVHPQSIVGHAEVSPAADQNKPPGMAETLSCVSNVSCALAVHSEQPDSCSTQQCSVASKKRHRPDETQSESNTDAFGASESRLLSQLPKRLKPGAEAPVDTFVLENAIPDDELGEYLCDRADEPARRLAWEVQQNSMSKRGGGRGQRKKKLW